MIGPIIVACFVLIVALFVCALIIAGIHADKLDLDRYPEDGPENIRI